MDSQLQTSFIPKKPVMEARAPISRASVSFMGIIATIAAVIAAILFGGSYFYRLTMVKQRDTLTTRIIESTKTFNSDFLKEVTALDRRINAANAVLGGHVLVSPIFTRMEQLTLKTIQFTKFEFTGKKEGSSTIGVKMAGKATGYAAIASQSDVLAGVNSQNNTYFLNPIFSNLNLDDKARVSFDLSFYVDPDLVSYRSYINRLSSTSTQ